MSLSHLACFRSRTVRVALEALCVVCGFLWTLSTNVIAEPLSSAGFGNGNELPVIDRDEFGTERENPLRVRYGPTPWAGSASAMNRASDDSSASPEITLMKSRLLTTAIPVQQRPMLPPAGTPASTASNSAATRRRASEILFQRGSSELSSSRELALSVLNRQEDPSQFLNSYYEFPPQGEDPNQFLRSRYHSRVLPEVRLTPEARLRRAVTHHQLAEFHSLLLDGTALWALAPTAQSTVSLGHHCAQSRDVRYLLACIWSIRRLTAPKEVPNALLAFFRAADATGNSVLFYALDYLPPEGVSVLLHTLGDAPLTPLQMRSLFRQANRYGLTPLHHVASFGDLESIWKLCQLCGFADFERYLSAKVDLIVGSDTADQLVIRSGSSPMRLLIRRQDQSILDFVNSLNQAMKTCEGLLKGMPSWDHLRILFAPTNAAQCEFRMARRVIENFYAGSDFLQFLALAARVHQVPALCDILKNQVIKVTPLMAAHSPPHKNNLRWSTHWPNSIPEGWSVSGDDP